MFHHDKLHTSKDIYHHNLYPHIHSYTANIHSLIYSLHSSLHNPHTHPQPISSIPTHIVNTKTMNHNSNTSKNTQSIVHSTHSILLSIAGLLIVCTKQLPLNKGSRFLLIGIGRNQVGRSSTMMENLRKIYMIYNSLYICCNTHPITDTPDCNWCIDWFVYPHNCYTYNSREDTLHFHKTVMIWSGR